MKKSFLLCLVLLILLPLALWANGKEEGGSAAGTIKVNPKGVFPIVDETYEMSILTAQDPLVISFEAEENEHVAWIQENTNIKINWTLVPQQQAAEKINLILASNTGLPDVFMENMSHDLVLKYGSEDLFVDMLPLIDEYGDEVNRAITDFKAEGVDFLGMYTAPDGKMYGLPSLNVCKWCETIARLWVRTDWMETLGLEMPDTVDEFVEVLTAMKNGDPNGNGKADEIPLMGSSQGWGTQIERYLMMPYIVYNAGPTNRLIKDENDNITAAYMDDKWVEGLAFIKELISEGLLDPVSLTQKSQEYKVMGEMDPPVVGAFLQSNFQSLTLKDDKYKSFEAIPPLEGVHTGVKQTYADGFRPFGQIKFVITEACESPEAAYRWADFQYSEENSIWQRYGKEGVDWIPAYPNQKGPFGAPAVFQEIGQWGEPTNRSLRQKMEYLSFKVLSGLAMAENSDSYYVMRTPKYMDVGIANGVPNVFMQPMEVDEFSELGTSLQNYVNESFARFVTGDIPLEDFDAFRDECTKIGLDRYLELYQAAYDRQFK